jgi:two-component system nitrogen regulation response regulator GlnG
VAAYKGGAFEYLPKPFDIDEAVDLVRKAARRNDTSAAHTGQPADAMASMIGQAPAMQEVFRSIGRSRASRGPAKSSSPGHCMNTAHERTNHLLH